MKALFFSLAVFGIAGLSSYTIIWTDRLVGNIGSGSVHVMPMTNADIDFLTSLHNINLFEISAAKLALKKSQNKSIKKFAGKMISDHNDLNITTQSVAARVMVTLPVQINNEELRGNLNTLKTLSGKEFDAQYVSMNVKEHQMCVSIFEKVINDGGYSPEVKQMVNDAIGNIKDHSAMANKLQNQIGK